MSKSTQHLTVEQVQKLNEKHGWFEFGDAQSDVSKTFAQDAISMHENMRSAAKDLYEAAKLVLAWYEAEDSQEPDFYKRGEMCRASELAIRSAIKKAEGAA
jgi:hypothetical protein